MRLKSLKLAGFKSFANPTTFTFKHDITAIVGPNGCGKSNVIDAIRWVLGESSAKQLRGGAMSDVIFAGTDGRAAKSLASVELTFEHTQDEQSGIRHALNTYHELTLRRQISMDGKSDYFINGQRVRRRDVVDVFLGTGLGARSYAVIEQGMIGRIIDADGQRLREFIEEAAGVSRYQARRLETEKQLTHASENLERLNDLQSELQKQHKTLKRQAEQACRYQDIKGRLQEVEVLLLMHRLYDAHQQHSHAKSSQATLSNELHCQNEHMENLKNQWQQLGSQLAQLDWQKDDAQKKHQNAQLAHQAAAHAYTQALSTIEHLSQNKEQLERQEQQSHDELNQKRNTHQMHQAALDELIPQLNALKKACATLKDEQKQQQADSSEIRGHLSELYNARQQKQNMLSLAEASLAKLTISLERWQHRQNTLNQEQQTLDNHTQKAGEILALNDKIASLQTQIANLDEERQNTQARQSDLSQQLNEQHTTLSEQEKRYSRLSSEYDTLHKLVYPTPTATASTNQSAINHPKIQDELQLSLLGQEHTKALDTLLSLLSQDGISPHIVPKDLIGGGGMGLWQLKSTTNKPTAQLPDGLIRLSQLITKPDLLLWDKVCIWDECTAIVWDELNWQQLDISLIITASGWLFTSTGAMHHKQFGIAQADVVSTRWQHKKRLDELNEELDLLDETLKIAQEQHKKTQSEYEQQQRISQEYTAQIQRLNQEYHECKHHYTKLVAEQDAHTKDQARIQLSLASLAQEYNEMQLERQELNHQIQNCQDKLADLAPEIQAAKSRQDTLNRQNTQLSQELAHKEHSIHKLSLEQQSHTQALSHMQELEQSWHNDQQKRQQAHQELIAKLDKLKSELPILQAAQEQAEQTATQYQAVLDGYNHELKQLHSEQQKLQDTRSANQETIDKLNADLAEIGAKLAVATARLQDISEQLSERVADFNMAKTLDDFNHNHKPSQSFDILSEQQKKLAYDLAKLGAVNLNAKTELDELEKRLHPMLADIDDVQASIVSLQKAIDTINQKTKTLFLSMLKSVNDELNILFAKVFGGGQASLSLMDDDRLAKADKWRAGLVLMAQPKGKKNARLAVLSGGEKTLTALSLIFAIFKQHPAPFCVLDEVDAPLDDANVGRFTSLIDELASEVQFIFISHNKLAMQSAHELKGVTMPTAGISALVSVNLDEAMAMVD